MRRSTRVAIVGGGPTGLMTALALARAGVASSVFERKRWPVDKVCGEGIMPAGVALLRRHGVLERIDRAWSRPFAGVRYVDADGRHASGRFDSAPGLIVRRTALSRALHEAAREQPLIELRERRALVDWLPAGAGLRLHLRPQGGGALESTEPFDYLIGADGIKSTVRRLAGMEGRPPGCQPRRMGARVHYAVAPWDELVQVWWGPGIECYVAPTSEGCVEFNFGWDDARVAARAWRGQSLEEGLFRFFPALEGRVAGRQRLSRLQSHGPLPQRARTPLCGRIALLGDAALFYDQVTGAGLTMGFAQADLAAATLPGWHTRGGRQRFRREMLRLQRAYLRKTGAAMLLTRHPLLRRGVIRLLERCPRLFGRLLAGEM